MTSGLKMLSSCKGCSAFVDCLLFGNKHLSYTCKCVLPFPPPYANLWTGRKIFNRPHETFSSFWGQKLFCGRDSSSEKRVAPLSGTSVAAFLFPASRGSFPGVRWRTPGKEPLLAGNVFGAKTWQTWLADHVTFCNCKVPDWKYWIVEFYFYVYWRCEYSHLLMEKRL